LRRHRQFVARRNPLALTPSAAFRSVRGRAGGAGSTKQGSFFPDQLSRISRQPVKFIRRRSVPAGALPMECFASKSNAAAKLRFAAAPRRLDNSFDPCAQGPNSLLHTSVVDRVWLQTVERRLPL
jgi:hypothetical protein